VTAILHWYSGALGHIDTALDASFYFSVNIAMLRSRSGLRVLAALPPDRVVSETDGPYTKIAGRASQPSDIPQTVLALSRTWNEEPDEARARICATMAALAQRARRGGDAATSTSRDGGRRSCRGRDRGDTRAVTATCQLLGTDRAPHRRPCPGGYR
jgi:hypothetical protein